MDNAARDALDVAQQALDGVACPRCGKRKQSFDAFPVLIRVLLIGGPVLLGVAVGSLSRAPNGALIGALVGAAVGLFQLVSRRGRVQRAGKEVTFFVGEPPDLPYIGKRCTICARSIVVEDDGTRCQTCGAPIHHKKCAKKHRATHSQPEEAPPLDESY